VSAEGELWVLVTASPDLRKQINDNAILHPRDALRESPIQAVVLTNADVDHVAGLLNLRESQPLNIYATPRVLAVLAANPIFGVLNPEFVKRIPMELGTTVDIMRPDGESTGVTIKPFGVPGKVALWLEDQSQGDNFGTVEEDTIALEVPDPATDRRFFYMPACARLTPELADRISGAELILFDGTLWVDDEMIRDGVGVKTGTRMGHMSVSGADGTIAALADLNIARKVFIHINTTNPILIADTKERAQLEAAGWEVSYDGMSLEV
jgi:pyrroloquinoline quinone biosynthesis protein B